MENRQHYDVSVVPENEGRKIVITLHSEEPMGAKEMVRILTQVIKNQIELYGMTFEDAKIQDGDICKKLLEC